MTVHSRNATEQLMAYVGCVFEPSDLVEVRRLPSKSSTWHNAEEISACAGELSNQNAAGESAYLGVNPRRRRGGKDRDSVVLARNVFADFDQVDLSEARRLIEEAGLPGPTLLIESGGGIHAYWRLQDAIEDLDLWSKYQRGLSVILHSDSKVHDPPRLMRAPGFLNHKYAPPRACLIVEAWPDRRYPLEDFGAALAAAATKQAPKFLSGHDGPVAEGDRNDSLFKQASAMRARGMSPQSITVALLAENQAKCVPPLPEAEVRQIASSACRYPAGASGSTEDSWEPPIPLGQFALPEFPLEAIPDRLAALREACAEVSRSYQVPPDLPALLAVAVGGAALARRVQVHGGDDWYEPVNVYVAVAMNPGERKSAVFREMAEPISVFERTLAGELKPQIEERQTERAILATALSNAVKKASRAKSPEERQQWTERAKQLTAELHEKPAIKAPQLIADDATPEALARLMFENGGRIAVLSPEGDTFDLIAGRYSANSAPNLGVYLKGHAGDDIRVNRVSKDRPPEYVRAPALTIGLAVQPAVLHGLMEKPGFRGKGLLARFIYSLPKSRVGYREPRPQAISSTVRQRYSQIIAAALSLKPDRDRDGEEQPHVLVLSERARHHLDEFRSTAETELRESGRLAGLRDWGAKLPGVVLRVAGIFHGLMYPEPWGARTIEAETMLCAVGVGEYAVAHALAAFFEMGADPAVGVARRILDWIGEERRSAFSRREVFMQLRGTIQRVEELDDPLRLLCDHGFIREHNSQRAPGPGRKPSQPYKVNPFFLAQNAQKTQRGVQEPDSAHSVHSALEV